MIEDGIDFGDEMKTELQAYFDLMLRWESYWHHRSAISRDIEVFAQQTRKRAKCLDKRAKRLQRLARVIREHDEAELVKLEQKMSKCGAYLKQLGYVQNLRPKKEAEPPFLLET